MGGWQAKDRGFLRMSTELGYLSVSLMFKLALSLKKEKKKFLPEERKLILHFAFLWLQKKSTCNVKQCSERAKLILHSAIIM